MNRETLRKLAGSLLAIIAVFSVYSCSTTKKLKNGQTLLRTNRIELKTDKTLAAKSALKEQLASLTFQKPNTYLFGVFPYKIWFGNIFHNDTATVNTAVPDQNSSRLTEMPVVYDSSLTERTVKNMQLYLFNMGYFNATVEAAVHTSPRKKKTKVTYTVDTRKGFMIDHVVYHIEDSSFNAIMGTSIRKGSLLQHATPYSNSLASAERSRIVQLAKNHGYFAFPAENIYFELDTSVTNQIKQKRNGAFVEELLHSVTVAREHPNPTINLKVVIRTADSTKFANGFKTYTYNKIYVLPDYDAQSQENINVSGKIEENDGLLYHFSGKPYIHPRILSKKIFLRPGQYFDQSRYDQTLSQLNDLGMFQYTRIYAIPDQDSTTQQLNAYVMLYPSKKYEFNTNFEVSGGDVYLVGTTVNAAVTNNNLLKGANKLTIGATYGIQLNQNSNQSGSIFNKLYLQTQNTGVNASLTFPKFLLPFRTDHWSQNMMPQSIMNLGYNFMSRINYFDLSNINFSFGYAWKETRTKNWKVTPVFLNRLHLSNIDSAFQQRMDTVQAIRNAYQETFIEGQNVEFSINDEGLNPRRHSYMKLALEEGGGLLSAMSGISDLFGEKFNFNYAHYMRFDFDFRHYIVRNISSMAFRFYGGVGIPYGGSTVLPYIKQYFVGGPYSIRGWGPRLLGPGGYYDQQVNDINRRLFVDQSGDIKLEMNAEYRFKMIKLFSGAMNLNGAIFADAGNIWLAHKDASLPNAEFDFRKLYQDVAMSAGAGIRADLGGFLVLRADLAFPIKKPYITENHGWVLDQIDFKSNTWRSNNLNLNIAIGYPF